MGNDDAPITQYRLWELYVRSITAQLTGQIVGAVHWIDAVSVQRAYDPPYAGGYWTSRCGVGGHFTAVLHRRSEGAWCQRCQRLPAREMQPGVDTIRLEKP